MLRIGYFADGKWSHNAFRLINEDRTNRVMFICARYGTQDLTLKQLAEDNGIDYFTYQNINSDDFVKKVKPYECDLFVSMSFDQIFKKEIFNLPRLKTINCHAGKLPYYRGRNVLNWVLINDEKEFGITVHYVDEGIDTGDIILQESYPITDDDTYATLLEIAYTQCAILLYKAIEMIKCNEVRLIKQTDIHPIGFYCTIRKEGDEVLNWNHTSREIFNFVRALSSPGPLARTHLNGNEMKIGKAKLISDAISYKTLPPPGQIVELDNSNLTVKTLDATIVISEFEYNGIIKIGDRLY